MIQKYRAGVLGKALAFWGVFMLLYFLYKYFPTPVLSLICGITESNFQHYKAGFFSYLIVNLVEYGWKKWKISDREAFVFSRMMVTIFLPWIIFLLWYLAPALIVRWPNNLYEIIYSNIIVLVVGVCAVILEGGLENVRYNKSIKSVLIILFLISVLLYVVFTFRLPWADVFIEPDWR